MKSRFVPSGVEYARGFRSAKISIHKGRNTTYTRGCVSALQWGKIYRHLCQSREFAAVSFDSGVFLFTIVIRMDSTEEEFVAEEEAEQGPAAIKSLRDKLKKAVAEKQEYLEGWQRARADLVNYKREEAQAHDEKETRILANFVESLLPALDAFEMALKHAPSDELELVHKQLLGSLKSIGVEQFGATGEDFDPHKHEALAKRGDDHKVESVERSGYAIHSDGQAGDKIIRPAQVII